MPTWGELGVRSGPNAHDFGVRMKRIWLTFLALGPLAAGCASTAPLRHAEVTPPPAYEAVQPDHDSLQAAALDDWWTLYHDAQLEDLVNRALANSPNARTALAVLQQAAAVREQSRAQIFLPTGNPSGTATETHTDIINSAGAVTIPGFNQAGNSNSLSANFDVGWELDLFGRRIVQNRAANADFYSAAFQYEATRTALIANVAQSLFQLRGLSLQLRDARETARIDKQLLDMVSTRVDRGLSAGGDLDQAAANSESANAQAESLQAQLTTAQRTLLVLVGAGFDPVASLAPDTPVGTPPPVPSAAPGDLLRRRPDVKQAELKLRSSVATLKVDQLALLPTIRLQPGVSLSRSSGAFGSTSAAWSIGANLTAPILDRPRLIGAVHAQRAVAEQAIISYESAVQTAYGDAENAFVYLDSDRRRVAFLTDAEAHAEAAYEKSRVGYERGLNDLQTALTAESTWRTTRTQLSAAQATLMQRSVQVFKALGGGWAPDAPAASTPLAAASSRGTK